jgi:outer membrane receptor protein involved in Fe transport
MHAARAGVKRFFARATLAALLPGLGALPAAGADEPASQTVTVTGKKAAVVKKIDKTVYDVSDLPKAANGTAQDVLQSTPELSVTADGHISVKGNAQVTVLVDGKPTAMMAGEERAVALQTMSGADIASIEVITNPSAAFSANGGAIVNIVLKRNRKPGKHAQLRSGIADHGLWNAGLSGDLSRNNLSLHGNVAVRRDGTQKVRQSLVAWHDPMTGASGHSAQGSEIFVRRVVNSAALGADVMLSDADSVSLSTHYNARRSRPLFDVLNENRTGAQESIFHRISYGPNAQSDSSSKLSYSHQGDASAVKAMLQRSKTIGLIDKSYRDEYLTPARATAYSRGATGSARRLDQATFDWSGRSDSGQWGAGVDLQQTVDEIDNYQAEVDPLTGAETPDAGTSNGYAVRSRLNAAYLTNQIRHGKWEVLLGGRIERLALHVRALQGSTPRGHWQAFNPSVHVQYALDDQTDLSLSYRRSLQRPDARDLNPYITYIDAQNLSGGNPALQPQRLTSWEVAANADTAALSRNVSAFYRSSDDTVTDARSFVDRVLLTSKQNGGRARAVGITTSIDWTRDPLLRLGMDAGAYRVMLDTPDLARLVRQADVAGYLKLRASYSAGADDVSVDAQAQSAAITPLGRYGATSSVNLSWKRQLSKTLSLTVNASDLFDGSKRSYQTDTSTFRQAGFDHFVARRLTLGLVKKFE